MRGHLIGILLLLVVPGLVSLYFGIFYTGIICDSSGGCATYHAGTVVVLPVVVGAGFLLMAGYTLWHAWRAGRG